MWSRLKRKIASWQNPEPSSHELVLNRHRIYIIPNKSGLTYALLLLTIFITSVNYGLNLGYALNFVLISCGWLGINFTYRNLAGIGLTATPSQSVYVGELAHFAMHLNNRARYARYALHIGFDRSAMQLIDIPELSSHNLTLPAKAEQRGWMPCPRIRLQTSFPYGLLTAWSYWKTTQQVLVYPQPEANPPPLPYSAAGNSGTLLTAGNDEFSGVRNYQPGDSLRQMAWRQMARQSTFDNEVLLSKHFEGGQQKICVLDFAALPARLSLEQKLSRLCAWVLAAQREQVSYAFKLGPLNTALASGEDHQQACLTALALFGRGDS